MDRRVCASLGLLGSLMVAAGAVACGSVAAEEKIVRDFFRASRMRDDATLSTFATAIKNSNGLAAHDERMAETQKAMQAATNAQQGKQ